MLLTKDELRSLAELKHSSPHTLLGMHPLGDKSGLVVRALLPDAAKVEVGPVHEKDRPKFELQRIPNTDIFEGITKNASAVYAYDLVITDKTGQHAPHARRVFLSADARRSGFVFVRQGRRAENLRQARRATARD